MKTYNVHFSFFDEEWVNFDYMPVRVEAENMFEARYKAWLLSDTNEDFKMKSCLKQYAVTWEADPLNIPDCLNAHAMSAIEEIGRIDYVDKPNIEISGKPEDMTRKEMDRQFHFGMLLAADSLAKDLGNGHHIVPPSVFEQVHYARLLRDYLYDEGKPEHADRLNKIAEKAAGGDICHVYDLRDIFKSGYMFADDDIYRFEGQLCKGGIYPFYKDREDREYGYIRRVKSAPRQTRLDRLPMYGENDVVKDSRGYAYFEGQILVMDKNHFKDEFQTPENMLWIATHGNGCNPNANGRSVWADNVITGEHVAFYRHDFLGVLRPELAANIDFEAIKAEYAAAYGDKSQTDELAGVQAGYDDEDEDEMEM